MSISSDYLHCRRCNTRVALMEDYIATIEQGGIFNRVFNVAVSDVVTNHRTLNENTIANAYCVQCEALIGGEFIAVLQPDMHVREGRFLMNLSTLSLRANEDNADQGGDTIDLDEDAPHQDGDTTDQDGDTTDQDGDADEKDLGTNGENVDQDGDTTEQNGDASDQCGDTTEKNEDTSDQYGDTNEQNANQDEDGNEQVPKEQNVGANEQNVQVQGIFKTVFNVEVSDEDNRQTLNGNIIANAYCIQCEELLGGEFIAVPQPDMYVREGRFYMTVSKIRLQPNEDNADQDGDIIDLDEDAPDQDGDTTDQEGDRDEQDLGTNGKNAAQDVDTTEKNGDTTDQYGDTTEQNGDANEKNANQDLGANEQNVDQDGGGNEKNHDEDGGQPTK